jgi:hypothetical protein
MSVPAQVFMVWCCSIHCVHHIPLVRLALVSSRTPVSWQCAQACLVLGIRQNAVVQPERGYGNVRRHESGITLNEYNGTPIADSHWLQGTALTICCRVHRPHYDTNPTNLTYCCVKLAALRCYPSQYNWRTGKSASLPAAVTVWIS